MKNIEGYWYSKYEPQYPNPIANDQPWDGQEAFLTSLHKKQFIAQLLRKINENS